METVLALTHLLWAPVLAVLVSAVYYRQAVFLPLRQRVAVSAHGALLALLYGTAFLVAATGASNAQLAIPFWISFLLPIVSILFALARFGGNRAIHLLQLVVAACAFWVLFIGTMAITGEWL